MIHERLNGRLVTPATAALALIVAAGIAAIAYRYAMGLGAATNLSDRYPWGLWVAVDVFSGVALAAGSFTTAALVYLFGGKDYQVFVRPAVLTGLLGYVLVAIAIAVDIGQPLHIWHPLIMWPEHSAMFEVAWCVMLYLAILGLEFVPAIFERFGWRGMGHAWRRVAPLLSAVLLALFVGVMSLSWTWALAALAVFAFLGALLEWGVPARPPVPALLIIAGVIFSTMHQSSLGTVFLLMPTKLDPLWWTPALPINFFLSAVAGGFAMVIIEAVVSATVFGRPLERGALAGMARFLTYALWLYLAFRIGDMALRGLLAGLASDKAHLFLLEMGIGVVLPAAMLPRARRAASLTPLLAAAGLVVLGVVFNRINAVWLAMHVPGPESYVPSAIEILVTASLIAAIVLLFGLSVRLLPVFPRAEEGLALAPGGVKAGTGPGPGAGRVVLHRGSEGGRFARQ